MGDVGFSDRVYSTTKLSVLIDVVGELGISPDAVLRDAGITPAEVASDGALMSLEHLIAAYRNAISLSPSRMLPYLIGSRLHLTAYGMYGYAMLCCTDFHRAVQFAGSYHKLAAPLCRIAFFERDDFAGWKIQPRHHPLIDSDLCRFITEVQIGTHISLHRDVMGPDFRPTRVALSYARANDFSVPEELLGCPVDYNQPETLMEFDAARLDCVPTMGNRTTFSSVEGLCNDLLAGLAEKAGSAGRIRRILLHNLAGPLSLEETAAQLGMTPRTLRRHLAQEGTSFRAVVDELRANLAIRYLSELSMTSEEVAFSVGFSDSANFRRAFRRWTGKSPGEYKRTAKAF
jgi:AraC-like DNA-binding protein